MPGTDLLVSHSPVFRVRDSHCGEMGRDCLRIDIEDSEDGLRTFVGHFQATAPGSNGRVEDLLYLDGDLVDFGVELDVNIGPPSGERRIFAGTVSAIEVSFAEGDVPVASVFAEDQLMTLRSTRRSATYENRSDEDIVREIADEHGLAAEVDIAGPTYDLVQQWGQSDLAFLRERARLIGAEVWVQDRTLHMANRSARSGVEVTLVQGNQLIELRARADLAHQRSSVTVSGYDAASRARIDETADSAVVSAEVSSGRTGLAILEEAFGGRPSFRVHHSPITDAEAEAWAAAELLRRARAFATVEGVTSGTPDLVVGTRVTLQRCGRPFDGSGWYTTWVNHSWDSQDGHRTRFRAERATVSS